MQNKDEINSFYKRNEDPWGYDDNLYDQLRREILVGELRGKEFDSILDIGCGNGFLTSALPGKSVLGVDISEHAISYAQKRCAHLSHIEFQQASLFDLPNYIRSHCDLVVITGVLYTQYIHNSIRYVYHIIDNLLLNGGMLVAVHIDDWYKARFPFFLEKSFIYKYRDYEHRFELYVK